MTKKSLNKLLSIILTIAICLSTVFGCLITANAADDVCCAVWSDGTTSKELDFATAKLTLNAVTEVEAEGFTTAYFELGTSDTMMLSAVAAESATLAADGTALTDDDLKDVAVEFENGYVIIDYKKRLSTITLKITFGFDGGYAKQGNVYNISVSTVQLSDGYNEHICNKTASFDIKASCDHVIAVKGDPINTDTINGYTVYAESYCTLCGEKFGYQLVPSTEPMNGTTIAWSAEGAYDDDLIDDVDGEQLGTAESPIIINSVEELYYLATMAGIDATADKYFKLADGIDNVVLQSEKVALDIMNLKTAAEVNTYFAENGGYKWDSTVSQNVSDGKAATFAFAGNFDGNGATFYGLYDTLSDSTNDSAGLFPYVYVVDNDLKDTLLNDTTKINTSAAISAKTITISNINLKNSHLTGTFGMGFIIGKSIARANEHYDWAANIKNCSVVNNYMYSNTGPSNSVRFNGLIVGRLDSYMKYGSTWAGRAAVNLNNCLVYGNSNATVQTDFAHGISVVGISHRGGTVKNSIILGTTPYLPNGAGENDIYNGFAANRSTRSLYSNVYTDAPLSMKWQTKVEKVDGVNVATAWTTINYGVDGTAAAVMFSITDDSVLGINAVNNCSNLDWGTTWSYGADGEYPSIASTGRSVIGWDNTKDTNLTDEKHSYSTQDGSIDNPIIIDSVAELYYLTRAGVAATANKHFKVADGIDTMVLQNAKYIQSIIDLEDAAQVKAYFSDTSKIPSPYQWYQTSWNSDPFAGYFDGNGVEIYGLCSNYASTAVAGLFPIVDTGATIKNLTLTNSYLNHTTKDNFDFGGLISRCFSGGSDTNGSGLVVVENVAVINNYIFKAADSHTRAGIISGNCGNDSILIKNCLVYGNDAKYSIDGTTKSYDMTLRANMHNQVPAPQDYVDANPDYVYNNTTYGWCYKAMVIDTIALDCLPYGTYHNGTGWALPFCFENVYTNSELVASANASEGTVEKWAKYVTVITTDDLSSAAAQKTAMQNLKWGTEWYANQNGYPTLVALDETSVATTSNGAFGLVAYNTSYKDDGSFDFNFYVEGQEGYDYVLYVGKTDNSGYTSFLKLEANDVTNPEIIAELGTNAMVATIPRLSARDVNTVWVPTLVSTNGAVTEWGQSKQIALADYANGVLNDKAVYADDVTDDIKLADKKVAAALLNYADAATKALTTPNDQPVSKNKVVYWNNQKTAPKSTAAGTKENPIIINTPAELAYIATATNSKDNVNSDKYYKIADDVKAFVLQPEDYAAEIMALSGSDAVNTYFSDTSKEFYQWQGVSDKTNIFSGNFDGNGVTIYGLYNTQSEKRQGLFGEVDGNATICNINVKGAYITTTTGWEGQGAIVGGNSNKYGVGPGTGGQDTLIVKNCSVIDCYMRSSDTANDNRPTNGVLVGRSLNGLIMIDNCFVMGNDTLFTKNTLSQEYALYGGALNSWNVTTNPYDNYYPNAVATAATGDCVCNMVVNTVSIGTLPYHLGYYGNRLDNKECFINVYIDGSAGTVANSYVNSKGETVNVPTTYAENQIANIDPANLVGANAMTTCSYLDWQSDWMITSGYPQPVQSGYIANEDKTLYWDGGRDTDLTDEEHDYSTQDGTAANPIIIDSAEELAYIAGDTKNYSKTGTPLVTQFYETAADGTITLTGPKHFKIADGIDKIVLQNSNYSEILNLTDSEKVRKYFAGETGVSGFTTWAGCGGWDGDGDTYSGMDSFCGAFDGNGVEIYGIYQNSALYGGLFGDVREDATIENVTVKNSYIVNNTTEGYRVGGIVGYSDCNTDNGKNITLNKCIVANCYLAVYQNVSTDIGHLVGQLQTQDAIITNCAVYGNQAWYDVASGSPKAATFIGNVQSSNVTRISDTIVLDAVPYGSNTSNNAVFSNVYTDQATSYSTVTTVTDLNTFKGSVAADIVGALNAANNKEVWYVGAAGDYPGFKKVDAIPNWLQVEYDTNTFTKFNDYSGGKAELRLKNAGFNLGANPYMSFVFGFDGAYKTDRQNIKIYIDYTLDGNNYITKEVSVPAFTEGAALSEGGWLSKANSTNHTYEFTDLPIKAFMHDIKVYAEYTGEAADKVAKTQIGTVSAEGLVNAFINASKKKPCNFNAASAEAAKALFFYVEMVNARYAQL